MTVYGFIPARGGSERVPSKNLQRIGNVSLVDLAIWCAVDSGCDHVLVSSDDVRIVGIARENDVVGIFRPDELSSAVSQIEDAIAHWLNRSTGIEDGDVIVLLQPTSPFRKPETVRKCVELVKAGYDSAVTISLEVRRNGRLRSWPEDGVHKVIWNHPDPLWRPRSQDARPEPYENGCVYAFSAGHFRRTRCRMGGREACVVTSWLEAFEIDTPEDLAVAHALVEVAASSGG